MASITVFSAPKSFTDAHIATIQHNAIASWSQLPDVDVILLGDEAGLDDAAHELGVKHLAGVTCSSSGTPLISSMFHLVRKISKSQLLCIVNADVVLMSDFVTAAHQVAEQRGRFVLLGRRWDLEVTRPIDFSSGWETFLRENVRSEGELHRPAGSDYFLFPRACYLDIPDFAIGRAGWDNWMIYKARKEHWPVIDATEAVMVVHQSHDYSHLPGGKPHYHHPETETNIRLAGGRAMTRFTLLDADHRLVDGKILPQLLDTSRLWRWIEAFPLLAFGSTRMSNALWRLRKLFK